MSFANETESMAGKIYKQNWSRRKEHTKKWWPSLSSNKDVIKRFFCHRRLSTRNCILSTLCAGCCRSVYFLCKNPLKIHLVFMPIKEEDELAIAF